MPIRYLVAKASYEEGILTEVQGYKWAGQYLGEEFSHTRPQIICLLSLGHSYVTISKATPLQWDMVASVNQVRTGSNLYLKTVNDFYPRDNLGVLPEALPKRKLFISYYHKADQRYKYLFESLFGDLMINKSVKDGDIIDGNSDEYIKHLIQDGYLDDTSIMVVLISQNTRCRKHIDWEISGALNVKVGSAYAGLIGLHLPHHIEYGYPYYHPLWQPARLADNALTGYAKIYDWTPDRVATQKRIEDAYYGRNVRVNAICNTRSVLSG